MTRNCHGESVVNTSACMIPFTFVLIHYALQFHGFEDIFNVVYFELQKGCIVLYITLNGTLLKVLHVVDCRTQTYG